jgi:hypothetical protein
MRPETSLKAMLRAAQVLDNSPRIMGFKLQEALTLVIRRAASVSWKRSCDCGDLILKDAGLVEVECSGRS